MTFHDVPAFHDVPEPEVGFATSGHTGQPVSWYRTMDQLRAEASLVARTVLGGIEHVINFAPTTHLFGRIFGEVLPTLYGSTVNQAWPDQLGLPEIRPGRRTLLVCLPSSWLVLRSLTDRIAALPSVIALHGTGPATAATDRVVAALAGTGFRAVEIFGSTETGGVGHRDITTGPRGPWRLLPDVQLVREPGPATEQLLHVRSPRLARRADQPRAPASYRLEDLVRVIDDRHFEMIGRRSRMIKINGRRCNLDRVEHAAQRAFPHVDAVCVPVTDAVRGEHYELFYRPAGPDPGSATLVSRLAVALPEIPAPRVVHRVDRVPRTITGKVKLDRLYAAANRPASGGPA